MRILCIGGTGVISTAVVDLALRRGYSVTLLNRGKSAERPPASGVERITADIRKPGEAKAALGNRTFDVVVDFVAFTSGHVATDIDLFTGRTGQYVFISSASAYQKPPAALPIRESTPLRNPYWQYSREKIACEDLLTAEYRERGFPVTIVRPSHTYDHTKIALTGGWTDIARMRAGRPVLVHGDGTSLWTLTHATDFAKAFVGLLGLPQAIGDAFTITSDEFLTWNAIYRIFAEAAGAPEPELVHVASETIAAHLPDIGPQLLGDKSHSVIFDNSKVRSLVADFTCTTPFALGAREIIAWHDADRRRQEVDAELDAGFDRVIAAGRSAASIDS